MMEFLSCSLPMRAVLLYIAKVNFFSVKTVCSDVACIVMQGLWLHMC